MLNNVNVIIFDSRKQNNVPHLHDNGPLKDLMPFLEFPDVASCSDRLLEALQSRKVLQLKIISVFLNHRLNIFLITITYLIL